jgi:hypothetical protein
VTIASLYWFSPAAPLCWCCLPMIPSIHLITWQFLSQMLQLNDHQRSIRFQNRTSFTFLIQIHFHLKCTYISWCFHYFVHPLYMLQIIHALHIGHKRVCNNCATCNSCQYNNRSDGFERLLLSGGYTDFISVRVAAVTWAFELSYHV